ncbi:MAG TPA: type IV secretion system DNA-binding domain-containing protein [bacterium]|nr:type IV secretion system DNA-binding domain-containing protein [bacterium]
MTRSSLIKIYHSYDRSWTAFADFLASLGKTLDERRVSFGLHYRRGEVFFSASANEETYPVFETQFYSAFGDFQLCEASEDLAQFDPETSVVADISLENGWFFPFASVKPEDENNFIFNVFRTVENFDAVNDAVSLFVDVRPVAEENIWFYLRARWAYWVFRIGLGLRFFRYMFNFRIDRGWKSKGDEYFRAKLSEELFETRVRLAVRSRSREEALGKAHALFNNWNAFKDYPLNQFSLAVRRISDGNALSARATANMFTAGELASFFHFPKAKGETSLLKVKSRKLAVPIGTKTLPYTRNNAGEILPILDEPGVNALGIADYRSTRVPIGIYDEDRLRHMYVIGKTGVGKSKFMLNLMRGDIAGGRGFGVIDPHGDLVEEIMMHMTEDRLKDLVIFDPTDEQYPFCFNPLDVSPTESKQILAKGFIDIFRKYFAANWNPRLEHMLRMVFLALLDRPGSTLFDIVRALTDKNFRYEMIPTISDDVVRNFWTNEFAGWSAQFNTEAIMPILNKVGQLLSIDMIRNIFASTENRLNLRDVMDSGKILLVKLPKGRLQEEIMGFLGAMMVTKLYQTAMGRQSVGVNDRRPFFLYIDEFQNFATDTFNEILSEARKYGLGLTVAHQFLKQVPDNISDSLFGNVGSIVSFRVSSEDASVMSRHFEPFVGAYDLANLNAREFYAKMLVKGQVKDPLSLRTVYTPDTPIHRGGVEYLYRLSRAKYCRSLAEAKAKVEEQKDIIETLESFSEPLL